ncbi:MAG: hypothetical protein ACR2GQ_08110 [Gemmatimonadota bacterium]
MILRLVWQSLRFAPGRSLFMLAGYALGVGVMVALLSIGDALVEQSRDRDLVGGGDVAVMPAGIDLETMRTGGVSSLYFRIELAPFFYREVLAGPRLAAVVARAAPWIDDELLYLELPGGAVPVSAGGSIPSAARVLGAGPDVLRGAWEDNDADRRWLAPDPAERLAQIDGFHAPPAAALGDSTWAEWHYFNVVSPSEDAWIYLTFLVGGNVTGERWGGQVLATYVPAGGAERAFERGVPGEDVRWSPGAVNVALGDATVELSGDGTYRVSARLPADGGALAGAEGEPGAEADAATGSTGSLAVDLVVRPEPRRYLPAIDVSPGGFPSGYAVPVLRGDASGSVCVDDRCEDWSGGRAYHDHNWGVWRDVTWDWGQFQVGSWSILYGGVQAVAPGDSDRAGARRGPPARFLFAVDSLGLAAVLPIESIEYEWSAGAPAAMRIAASRGDDRLEVVANVGHVQSSRRDRRSAVGDLFFQMRGPVEMMGEIGGEAVRATGSGFFETWTRDGNPPAGPDR